MTRDGSAPAAGERGRTGEAPVPPRVSPDAARRSLLQTLLDEPARFSFDAALSVLMRASGRGDPGSAVRHEAALGLAFVPSDVLAIRRSDDGGFIARTGLLGLTGPAGVLPRPYTELAISEARNRSSALGQFLDLLAQRPAAQFAAAGVKYRPARSAEAAAVGGAGATVSPQDGIRDALLALVGYADPDLQARARPGLEPLLFYSGAFSARPRSVDRLGSLLSEWLGRPVAVEQFTGGWLELGQDQMTMLPRAGGGRFNRLGVDAAIGARAWDIQSRITLRIGPLDLEEFNALLPGGALLERLAALARAYLGAATGFAVNPVLAARAVPAPTLGPDAPCRLGWTGWLPVSGGRRRDAAEATFSSARIAEAA